MGSAISIMIFGLLITYYGGTEVNLAWVRIVGLVVHFIGLVITTECFDSLRNRIKTLERTQLEKENSKNG